MPAEETTTNSAGGNMSSVPQGNRFAPPTAHVEDVEHHAAGTLELAGRGARFGAMLIDVLLLWAAFWGLSTLFFPSLMQDVGSGVISIVKLIAYQVLLGFGLFLLLNGWLLATQGQTLGKKLLKMRIVRPDGAQAGFVRLFFVRYLLNNLLCMIPLLGLLYALGDCLAIFRESRRCLHDSIADTIVVKA
jgi:uncharacterized RDD family membrane protein YckC